MSVAHTGQLPRRLNLYAAVAVVVGITVGSGIFRVPSEVATQSGAAGGMLLVWVAGGLLTLCFALLLAELGAMFPRAGGLYGFVYESWGSLPAFVFGWTYLLINPAGWAAIATVFAEYLGKFVPLTEFGRRGIALGLILLLGVVNYHSVRLGASIQNVLSSLKLLALLALALLILALGDPAGGTFAQPVAWAPTSSAGFLFALVAVLWAYDGLATFCSMIGEVKQPQRNVPRALFIGIGAVMLLYLVVNAAYLYVLPLDVVSSSPLVAADAAARVLGAGGAALISALVMVSTLGAVACVSMADPRVFFAMARDGNFFAAIGRVHPRHETPHVAIVTATAVAAAYVCIRSFEQLAATFVLGLMPFYALAVIGVWRLRRTQPEAERPYRAFGYPWTLVLYVAGVLVVLGNALIHAPKIALVNVAISLAGVPIYYVWKRFYR